jgi:hypothetical protein
MTENSEALESAAGAAEEAMRDISVCEGADGMSYSLLDAMAEARCEKELGGAGDVLRDASLDVASAAIIAFLSHGALVEAVAQTLYEQEKARATRANAIISGTGLCIEPYEECADSSWRPDARAALTTLRSAAGDETP